MTLSYIYNSHIFLHPSENEIQLSVHARGMQDAALNDVCAFNSFFKVIDSVVLTEEEEEEEGKNIRAKKLPVAVLIDGERKRST